MVWVSGSDCTEMICQEGLIWHFLEVRLRFSYTDVSGIHMTADGVWLRQKQIRISGLKNGDRPLKGIREIFVICMTGVGGLVSSGNARHGIRIC
jgi:hypothetical protein